MALVNIPRDRDDPNYRYKMPKLISKIEGRGNGIKTNISNMGEISRALKRPPMYPTKFFGCELGAMAKFEEAEEKALVNGAHKESDLVIILDKFIQMYVLCPSCELPEIDINVKKGLLTCKCNACGYIGSLDNVHKAATYMVRNPPDAASSTMGKKKKSKEERRAEKQQQQRDKKDRTSWKSKNLGENGDDTEDKDTEEGGGEAEKQHEDGEEDGGSNGCNSISSSSSGCSSSTKCGSADNVGTLTNGAQTHTTKKSHAERSADTSPTNEREAESWDEQPQEKSREARKRDRRERRVAAAAEAERRQLLHKEALVLESPELQDVIERLRNVTVKSEKVDIETFFQELRMLQVSQDFDAKCRMYVTLGALFKDGITPASLEKRMAYVTKVVDSSVSAVDVLDALGYFVFEQGTATLASFPYFLQKLYNAEVLEAEDILNYYKEEKADPVYTACRKHAGPFLQWLREDDEEDEEKQEEQEEEEEKSCISELSFDDVEEVEEDEEVVEQQKDVQKQEGVEEAAVVEKPSKEVTVSKQSTGNKDETEKTEEGDEKENSKAHGQSRVTKDGSEDNYDDDTEDVDQEEKIIKDEKAAKGKTGKDKSDKKNKQNSNTGKRGGGEASPQREETTGSGGEKAKGRKEDIQQKNGGKGKKKSK